jgi:hypothetical protein
METRLPKIQRATARICADKSLPFLPRVGLFGGRSSGRGSFSGLAVGSQYQYLVTLLLRGLRFPHSFDKECPGNDCRRPHLGGP